MDYIVKNLTKKGVKMNILQLLCEIEDTQGGTIHQYARDYKTNSSVLLSIKKEKIDLIYEILTTGKNANNFIDIARKYYKRKLVSIKDICKMLINYEIEKNKLYM